MSDFYDFWIGQGSVTPERGRPRRDSIRVLHDKIVWSAWTIAEGGEANLRKHVLLRDRSEDHALSMRLDAFNACKQGQRSLSPAKRLALIKRHSSLQAVMEWPLDLLGLKAVSRQTINARMAPFLRPAKAWRHAACDRVYRFPGDDTRPLAPNRACAIEYLNHWGLYERGDAYGFLAIAAAFRLLDVRKDRDAQWNCARSLIRALPAFCREPCVRPHADEIIALVEDLLVLLPDNMLNLEIDHSVIWTQIDANTHQPSAEMRLLATECGLVREEPRDPIVRYVYRRCQ